MAITASREAAAAGNLGAGDGEQEPVNSGSRPRKALTIGAVAKILSQEFEDISISKIRYLEEQKLLAPRRTEGGYRLYSQADVERLRRILRMQRDEFLPLRVIRQELATGDFSGTRSAGDGSHQKRRAVSVDGEVSVMTPEELMQEAGVSAEFLRELSEYGVIQAERHHGRPAFDETDLEIVRAANELARYGVAGRNLRIFRTSADREAALLQQIVGASLRSRSPQRRREAVESLESLAGVCAQLKHLMLVRDLRRLKGDAA